MWAATPIFTVFDGSGCGPIVDPNGQFGFEQRYPTRLARVSMVFAEKLSAHDLPLLHTDISAGLFKFVDKYKLTGK